MQISVFDVKEDKKLECETKFKNNVLASGKSEDSLYDLIFKDAAIHSVSCCDGVAIHDKNAIVYFDNCDYSIIKIL